jgi:hypothetical protein
MCGMNHLVDDDPSLREILDLEPWQEAERLELGGSRFRSPIPADFDA